MLVDKCCCISQAHLFVVGFSRINEFLNSNRLKEEKKVFSVFWDILKEGEQSNIDFQNN